MAGWVIALLLVWAVLAVVGFAIKALFWLAIVGLVLFVLTAITGMMTRDRVP